MAYTMPDEFDPENMDDRIVPGQYQILVQNVDDRGEKSIVVDYEVLNGTNADMIGKVAKEFLPKKAAGAKRVTLFAIATGLTTIDKMVENKKAGVPNSWDFAGSVNKRLVVEIAKNGDRSSWTFSGIYACDDPNVKDVPQTPPDAAGGDSAAGAVGKIPF